MRVHHWNPADGPLSEAALRAKLEAMGYTVARYVYPPGTRFPDTRHTLSQHPFLFATNRRGAVFPR